MADKKITQLTDGGTPQSTDEFVVARGGDNFKIDYASLEAETILDAVIIDPAASTRNIIVPQNSNTIALTVQSPVGWQVGTAAGDMLDFQDENGDLMAGFYRDQSNDTRAFFLYDDTNHDVGAFLTSKGLSQNVATAATFPPIWIRNFDGSVDLFRVLPSGAVLITPDDPDAAVALLVKSRTSGNVNGKHVFELQDTVGRPRIYADFYEFEDPGAGESDTYIYFSSGEGQAAGDPSVIDFNFLREGDFSGNKVAFAWEMICDSSTSGYMSVQRYLNGQGGVVRPFKIDWATGCVRLGGSGGVNIFDVNHAVNIGPTAAAGTIPLTIQARSDQTGDLLGIVDINAVLYSRINKAGYFFTRKIAAPADGDLANSEGGWWWDEANSVPKWKGKQSGGTVVNFTPGASGSGAPTTATYITQTADAGLSAEQALSSLATGLVKNTTGTGVLSIGAQGTDYYAPGGTDVAVADGGTGSSTASAARTALGLVIDTDVASMTTANAKVPKSLYDANTVLAADTDDTPAAVTMAASTILARLAAGNIKAASVAEIVALLQAYAVGGTDVAVTDGGTGASTASGARTNLGLVIGTDVAAQGDVRFASHENGQAGVVAPTFWGWQFEGSAFVANRCLLARFVPTKDLAITKMAFMVHAAGAAGNKIDVGIYSGDLATRLGSSGSVVTSPTMASAGVKELALTGTVNLTAGTTYYAAIVPDTTAGQIAGAMINNNGTAGSESLFGTAIGKFETGVKDVGSGVLPTSIATPTPSSYQGPVLAVRVS